MQDRPAKQQDFTLYPAAYPNPGNNDVNFVPKPAEAYSLKMTEFRVPADETFQIVNTPTIKCPYALPYLALMAHQSLCYRVDLLESVEGI